MSEETALVDSVMALATRALSEHVADYLTGDRHSDEWHELSEMLLPDEKWSSQPIDLCNTDGLLALLSLEVPGYGQIFEVSGGQLRKIESVGSILRGWNGSYSLMDTSDVDVLCEQLGDVLLSFNLKNAASELRTLIAEDAVRPAVISNESFESTPGINDLGVGGRGTPPDPSSIQIDIHASNVLTPETLRSLENKFSAKHMVEYVEIRSLEWSGPATLGISYVAGGQAISKPLERLIQVESGVTRVDGFAIEFDPGRLDDMVPGIDSQLVVQLRHGSLAVSELRQSVQILAPSRWQGASDAIGAETLAAFVLPQDPEIQKLLVSANAIFTQQTNSSIFDFYSAVDARSAAERIDRIVECIYESIARTDISLIDSSPSWRGTPSEGFPLGTPTDVLVARRGTRLDIVLTLAAALEAAGINSAVFLASDRVFVGYYRNASRSRLVSRFDFSEALAKMHNGSLRIIDPVAMTSTARASIMDGAAQVRWEIATVGSQTQTQDTRVVVDLQAARLAGIFPAAGLVANGRNANRVTSYTSMQQNLLGETKITVALNNAPIKLPTLAKTVSRLGIAQATRGIDQPSRVEQWKKQLLDLTFRNKLLNFAPRTRFPLAVPGDALADFIELLENDKAFGLVPSEQLDSGSTAEKCATVSQPNARRRQSLVKTRRIQVPLVEEKYVRQLRSIQGAAQTEAQEAGSNSLFLAVGTLRWTLASSTYVSPLVLIPAVLSTSGDEQFKIEIDPAGTVQPNLCLMEKLRLEFGIETREVTEAASRSGGFDVESFFTAFGGKLRQAGVQFEIERTVDLANLQFAKFRMWKDLDEHWTQISRNAVVNHLTRGKAGRFTNDRHKQSKQQIVDLDVLAENCPLPADSTQLTAISRAVNGETFILEGPPGTGKSQTITNMIAVAMAQGKSVLFVAEKRAALDVVKRRLEAAGLDKYTLDLHDKHARISHVRRQIRVALEHKGEGADGIDAGLPEQLQQVRSELATYATKLHEPNSLGFSLYSARTQQLAINDTVVALPIPEQFVRQRGAQSVQRLRQQLDDLATTAAPAKPAVRHPWGFLGTSVPDSSLSGIFKAAEAYSKSLEDIVSSVSDPDVVQIVEVSVTPGNFRLIAKVLRAGVPIRLLDKVSIPNWQEKTHSYLLRFEEILGMASPMYEIFTHEILDLDLDGLVSDAETAVQSGFMGIGRKKNVRAVIESLGNAWRGMHTDEATIVVSLRKAQTLHRKIQDLRRDINAHTGLELPDDWSPLDAQHLGDLKGRVESLTESSRTWQALKKSEKLSVLAPVDRLVDKSNARHRAADDLLAFAAKWQDLLEQIPGTQDAVDVWAAGRPLATSWFKTDWERRTDWSGERDLRAWNTFQHALKPIHDAGLEQAADLLRTGRYPLENAVVGFDKGLANALVAERLGATELKRFNPVDHERKVQAFNQRSKEMRQQLRRTIPEAIIRNRNIASADHKSRAKLLRQAIKPAGMGTRELMVTFPDVITRVMPCTLVSPDSVARFFPAEAGMFDLVIFDEASQIRVADALGAVGRAKAVVVVGDSQQMPPTSVAMSSLQDENEGLDEVVMDEESILRECEQSGIPRLWLSGHYRSQSESLIAFSNQHFYENRLTTFPAPRVDGGEEQEAGYGISLVKVDGRFYRSNDSGIDAKLKRTNPIEARAIVNAVKLRFAKSRNDVPSLGVITFNAQQRDLIEGMLRDDENSRLEEALEGDNGLFVKNLENVQGDERDTIFFSTAFSPDEKGILPLNFGPLNHAGGERRLNVAVTRARKEVIVFSSFAPEQLRAENSASVGIKRLRDYLDLAQKGTKILSSNTQSAHRVDRHREQIAEQLRARGFVVKTSVGLSNFRIDLVVSSPERPDKPLVAILLDGEDWAERKTVGDRDGLPQQVLEGVLGWPATMRIWMPDWHSNANAVSNRVRSKVATALREVGRKEVQQRRSEEGVSVEPSPVEKRVEVLDDVDVNRQHPLTREQRRIPAGMEPLFSEDLLTGGGPSKGTESRPDAVPNVQEQMHERKDAAVSAYEPWRPRIAGSRAELDELSSRKVAGRARALLGEIVDAEWPINSSRIGTLANRAFGLSKVSMARELAIVRLLDHTKYKRDSEGFVWPKSIDFGRWRGYRTGTVLWPDMSLVQISPTEIANAMEAILTVNNPMVRDDLFRATALEFGGRRLPTSWSATWVDKGLDVARQRKSIRLTNGFYQLVQ